MGNKRVRAVGEPLADIDSGTYAAIERAVIKRRVQERRQRAEADKRKRAGEAADE